MRQLSATELEDIVNGAAFLGSGGGAPLAMGKALVKLIAEPVQLIDITEVGAEQWGAAPGGMGATKTAPSSSSEFSHDFFTKAITITIGAFERLEKTLNKTFSYTLAQEIGTGNLVGALLTASIKKIPIVDGDGAGRAVPKLDMTTYAATGISISPFALANLKFEKEKQVEMVIYAETFSMMEKLVRGIIGTEEFGNLGTIATYAMSGETLHQKQPIVLGTISLSQAVGTTLRQATERGTDPVEAVLDFFNHPSRGEEKSAFKLFRGRISAIEEKFTGGFQWGSLTLENGEERMKVIFQNESLIAWRGDKPEPIAMAPDLICYLTPEGVPLTNADTLNAGDELAIIGVKAPSELRQPSIIEEFLKTLKELGYDGPYLPIEQLQ